MILYSTPWQSKRNKIAIFFMAFSGDTQCLKQAVRAINRLKDRYDFEIFVLDDANSPMTDVPAGCKKSLSFFNRNGNLNGAECAHGMLIHMLRCARDCKAEYILKVDSDMIIKDLDNFLRPLEYNREQVIGFKLSPQMNYVAGVCYLLPVNALYETIKHFRAWFNHELTKEDCPKHCPEDWAITRSVSTINNIPLLQYNQVDESQNWLMSPFNYTETKISDDAIDIPNLSLARFSMYDFVNFGNRHQIESEKPREIAATCMKRFNDFLEKSLIC